MHQKIAAEDDIGSGERVLDGVEQAERPPRPGIFLLIRFDQLGNDIGSKVIDWQVQQSHPVEVAAGHVEHRPDAEIGQKPNQLGAKETSRGFGGTMAGMRLGVAPRIRLVNFFENVRHRGSTYAARRRQRATMFVPSSALLQRQPAGLATVATCAYLCEQRFFQGQNLTAKPAVFSMSWLGLQSNNPLGNTSPP